MTLKLWHVLELDTWVDTLKHLLVQIQLQGVLGMYAYLETLHLNFIESLLSKTALVQSGWIKAICEVLQQIVSSLQIKTFYL